LRRDILCPAADAGADQCDPACRTDYRGGGAMRWNLRLDTALRPDITIAVRLAPDNEQSMDYYLLPHIDIKASRLRIAQRNGIFLDAYRFDPLHRFFQISARTRLGSAE
jgi:hypothetical protein